MGVPLIRNVFKAFVGVSEQDFSFFIHFWDFFILFLFLIVYLLLFFKGQVVQVLGRKNGTFLDDR